MKSRNVCHFAVGLAALCVAAGQSMAAPTFGGTMRYVGQQFNGPLTGGEFVWDSTGSSFGLNFAPEGLGSHGVAADHFISFCVQTKEFIGSGTYEVDLNTESVILGGTPLANETAWLYERFIKGTLAGYDYSDSSALGRDGSGAALQAAIWDFQGQSYDASGLGAGAGSMLELRDYFKTLATTAAPTGIGHVRILNVWVLGGNRSTLADAKQDMLVMIPLPAPVWMAGVGLFGVVGGTIYRRRFSGRSVSDSI